MWTSMSRICNMKLSTPGATGFGGVSRVCAMRRRIRSTESAENTAEKSFRVSCFGFRCLGRSRFQRVSSCRAGGRRLFALTSRLLAATVGVWVPEYRAGSHGWWPLAAWLPSCSEWSGLGALSGNRLVPDHRRLPTSRFLPSHPSRCCRPPRPSGRHPDRISRVGLPARTARRSPARWS
jgi:hypothetical protein